MKLLCLDTSTSHFSLAVSEGKKFLAARTIKNDRFLSSKIILALDHLFAKAEIEARQLDAIAVGLGPGSFTSLRVGLATVKGIAYALGKPVIGVSSLDLIAMNVKKNEADMVCPFVDARRGMIYTAVYECREEGLERLTDYLLVEPKKIVTKLKGAVAFAGNALPLYQSLLEEKSKLKSARFSIKILDEKRWYPSAKNLSRVAQERFEYKDFDNIDTVIPLYLYPEDCQVRR